MEIKNEQDLKKMMEKLAGEALEDASEEVLEIFKRDYIMGYAYIDNPKEYRRTFEFKEAWDFTALKKQANTILKELWYDPTKLKTFDPDRFIHGSKYSSPNDIRDNLPAILEGKRSSLWLSVPRKGKFWEEFIQEMFSKGELDKILTKHFSKRGFVRI